MELPAETSIRWILRHTASLLSLGAEPVRGLVTPTADRFPDAFDGSPKSVLALLRRIEEHAGLSHAESELSIVTPEGETETLGGCSSGACGGGGKMGLDASLQRLAKKDDGSYAVAVASGETKSPIVLTTALVRAVTGIFMHESGAYEEVEPGDREAATDLAAVLLGFGPLVANGSYIYKKGCGGVAVHSATKMPVEDVTLALAVFCRLHEIPDTSAARHLEVTPRAHFEEAAVWAASNGSLVRRLRSDPQAILEDRFSLSPARSWIARALGLGKKKPVVGEDLDELERALVTAAPPKSPRTVDPQRARRLAEIKALMDDAE